MRDLGTARNSEEAARWEIAQRLAAANRRCLEKLVRLRDEAAIQLADLRRQRQGLRAYARLAVPAPVPTGGDERRRRGPSGTVGKDANGGKEGS